MSPMLKTVERAGIAGLHRKRNPMAISTSDFFTDADHLRSAFAKLINLPQTNRAVIIPSVSYGMATVVKNVAWRSGDEIIVAGEQFPSNVYPWMRVATQHGVKLTVVAPPDGLAHRGQQWNEKIIEAIGARTRLVALGHVHWADGTLFDLMALRQRTRAVDALLIIDGTQSVGALPFDVQQIEPDALICAGYKWLMGPYALGLAYYGDYFSHGLPLEENWINRLHSEDFTGLVNYQTSYQPGALRYEVGEHSNFILVPMLLAALKQVNRWMPENIQSYCTKITECSVSALREAGFWIEDKHRASHLWGIRLPQHKSLARVKERLQQKKFSVSFRGDAIRVSPHVYNTAEEMNRFAKILIES